ncbi:MAG: 16S rRNA (cytosine(1402)-N(4))-methyltransferase, partial [Proteobacteria bacterium]|nr:16S rRNA (cytosine(1402)-N(4))-methyltransferase [Pseudomonadota bacterium]
MNHVPVLLEEVLRTLGDLGGKTIVDCTFGAGGYSRAFLAAGANVIAFDRDSSVMPAAEKFASEYGPERFLFINAPFSEIGNLIRPPTGPQPRAPTPPKGGVVKCSPGAARMSAELLP